MKVRPVHCKGIAAFQDGTVQNGKEENGTTLALPIDIVSW